MSKTSQPGRVSRLTPNTSSGFRITSSTAVGARFYKPVFVYQGAGNGVERYTYVKGYN